MKILSLSIFAFVQLFFFAYPIHSQDREINNLFNISSMKMHHFDFSSASLADILHHYDQVKIKSIPIDKSEVHTGETIFKNNEFQFSDQDTFTNKGYKLLKQNVYYIKNYDKSIDFPAHYSMFTIGYGDIPDWSSPKIVELEKLLKLKIKDDFRLEILNYNNKHQITSKFNLGSLMHFEYKNGILYRARFSLLEWGIDLIEITFEYQINHNFREIKKASLKFKKDESDPWKPYEDWYFTYRYKSPEVIPFIYIVNTSYGLWVREEPNLTAKKIGVMPHKLKIAAYQESKNTETIDGITAPWMRIKAVANGKYMEGWAWGGYLKKFVYTE